MSLPRHDKDLVFLALHTFVEDRGLDLDPALHSIRGPRTVFFAGRSARLRALCSSGTRFLVRHCI